MSSVDPRSTETAYATKTNIVVPSHLAPTAAHLTVLETRAKARMQDGAGQPTVSAVQSLKKG